MPGQQLASARSRDVAVVFNPSKNRGQLRRFMVAANAYVDRLTVYESTSLADVSEKTAKAVADGHTTVLAAGGDGTVFGVLNGLSGSGAVLGVLPLGTSNDYARSLGITDVLQTARALNVGRSRYVDVGRCTFITPSGVPETRLFCSTSGVGFTARLFQDQDRPLMRIAKRVAGDAAWVLASLRYGVTFRGSPSRLEFDDARAHASVWLLSVNKVASEGGMPVTPFARLDSGHLDACLVPDLSLARKLKLLVSLQRSAAHIHWPEIDYFGADGMHNRYGMGGLRRLVVAPAQRLPLHLNGEFLGYTPATFEIVPATLPVLMLVDDG